MIIALGVDLTIPDQESSDKKLKLTMRSENNVYRSKLFEDMSKSICWKDKRCDIIPSYFEARPKRRSIDSLREIPITTSVDLLVEEKNDFFKSFLQARKRLTLLAQFNFPSSSIEQEDMSKSGRYASETDMMFKIELTIFTDTCGRIKADFFFSALALREDIDETLKKAVVSARYISGKEVNNFENDMKVSSVLLHAGASYRGYFGGA